jgi:hypothetical protein
MEIWQQCVVPVEDWGFAPRMPEFRSKDTRNDWIASQVARFLHAPWWERKINRAWDRYNEHAAILLGKVRRGVSPYVSHQTLKIARQRYLASQRWIKEMEVINEEHNLVIPLEDAVNASTANKTNRRNELMSRARGFENLADELGHQGVFITWTAPSRFHAWKTRKDGRSIENERYNGSTPRDTSLYLGKLWARARARLNRLGLHVYGFRVAEPHHDGTPHWHLLLFMSPQDLPAVIGTLQQHALTDDKAELERTHPLTRRPFTDFTPRFDWKLIDPTKGDATGYIAAYVAKNIDGAYLEDDEESGLNGNEGAMAAVAWASWWRIRPFQQIGGAPVGVWRELRRMSNIKTQQSFIGPPKPVSKDPVFEACRLWADKGMWKEYVKAMNGPVCSRREYSVQLMKVVDEGANCYGEDVLRLIGCMSARIKHETRLQGWKIVPKGKHQIGAPQGTQAITPGPSRAPWSSDNNCTLPDHDAFADQIMREQWGLSPFSIDRLRAGASVRTDGFTLWLGNGQLQSCRSLPSEPDWQPEGLRPAERDQPDEFAVPEGDQDWPMLVELCGQVYQAQGHAGAHRWIEMLPQPYQSEMWRVLEGLDVPEWLQELNDCSEKEWKS